MRCKLDDEVILTEMRSFPRHQYLQPMTPPRVNARNRNSSLRTYCPPAKVQLAWINKARLLSNVPCYIHLYSNNKALIAIMAMLGSDYSVGSSSSGSLSSLNSQLLTHGWSKRPLNLDGLSERDLADVVAVFFELLGSSLVR